MPPAMKRDPARPPPIVEPDVDRLQVCPALGRELAVVGARHLEPERLQPALLPRRADARDRLPVSSAPNT